jgi:dTDP-4-dehydrorhamnose reductase
VIRFLITGAQGLLGSNICKILATEDGIEVAGTDILQSGSYQTESFFQGNLLDPGFIESLLRSTKPAVIINTVALPDIDKCENEPALAKKINVETAELLAIAAKQAGCRILHISTDQLFSGEKTFSLEQESPNPVNIYAKTKLDAENAVLKIIPNSVILRTNFYGQSPAGHGKTFGEWLYTSLKDHVPIHLITDYYFTPIEVSYFVRALKIVALSKFCGILNIAGTERCSKYEFGMAMAREFEFQTDNIVPRKSNELPNRVKRPQDISLSTKKFSSLFNFELPDIKTGLKAFRQSLYS